MADKPTLDALRELTGEGAQQVISVADGTVTGNFYKVMFLKGGVMTDITVAGQSSTGLDGMTVVRHALFYNVTSITLASPCVAICYTNPTVPAIE